jgi:hypothetical protein
MRAISFKEIFQLVIIVKIIALVIKDAVKGIQGDQCKIILAFFPGAFEEFIKHIGGCHHSGPAIELKPIDLVLIASAPGFIAFFEDLNIVAARRQANCSP